MYYSDVKKPCGALPVGYGTGSGNTNIYVGTLVLVALAGTSQLYRFAKFVTAPDRSPAPPVSVAGIVRVLRVPGVVLIAAACLLAACGGSSATAGSPSAGN